MINTTYPFAVDTDALPTPAPLAVSSEPWPGDIRLVVHCQPDADLGAIDVHLGLGKGTRGKGKRAADDDALYVATLYRLAQHLTEYAASYDSAAREDSEEIAFYTQGQPRGTGETSPRGFSPSP